MILSIMQLSPLRMEVKEGKEGHREGRKEGEGERERKGREGKGERMNSGASCLESESLL